jgi:predicted nucleic acid-binding protein
MSGNKIRSIYWDANIFIAWLSGENRDPDEMNGIAEQLEMLEKGKLIICTSTITLTEVLRSKLLPHNAELFGLLFKRPSYQLIDVSRKVIATAHDIRDYYSRHKEAASTDLTTPDAIHLASAIEEGCEVFYTFDGKDSRGKSRTLIPLSGPIAGGLHYLIIEKPKVSPNYQPKLPGMK